MVEQREEHFPETLLPKRARQARPLIDDHGEQGAHAAVANLGPRVLADALQGRRGRAAGMAQRCRQAR